MANPENLPRRLGTIPYGVHGSNWPQIVGVISRSPLHGAGGGLLGQKGLGTKTKFAEQIGGQSAEQNPFLESFLGPKIASNRLKMTPKMGWFS